MLATWVLFPFLIERRGGEARRLLSSLCAFATQRSAGLRNNRKRGSRWDSAVWDFSGKKGSVDVWGLPALNGLNRNAAVGLLHKQGIYSLGKGLHIKSDFRLVWRMGLAHHAAASEVHEV